MEVAVMHILLLFMLSILSHQKFSNANDTINTTQSIRGNETLVSRNFELGFFSLGNSSNWYVGIWYKDITPKTVVWVANREIPLKNTTSSIFKVIPPGLLVILNETNNVIWSSNNSGSAKKPVAQLLDTGNLVLRDEDNLHPDNHLWQSFDHPTNTYLPGMVIQKMSSWKSDEDPAPGDFTISLDHSGYPQLFIAKNGIVYYKRGPWNGVAFSGAPNLRRDSTITMTVSRNKEGDFYYKGHSTDTSVISRLILSPTGVGERWTWVHRTHEWVRFTKFPEGAEFPFSIDVQITHIAAGSHPAETRNQDLELPKFDLSTISKATDSFSSRNRIGEGGYGPPVNFLPPLGSPSSLSFSLVLDFPS